MTLSVKLHPFPDDQATQPPWRDLSLHCIVERSPHGLRLRYLLSGNLGSLFLPGISPTPQRADHLWESTCFEFFVGVPHSSIYWEANLSPKGDWNLYHFEDYRQGMQTEMSVSSLAIQISQTQDPYELHCHLPLSHLAIDHEPLELSLTAVLATPSGEISYWAAHHGGKEPDFHRRDSFTLRLH